MKSVDAVVEGAVLSYNTVYRWGRAVSFIPNEQGILLVGFSSFGEKTEFESVYIEETCGKKVGCCQLAGKILMIGLDKYGIYSYCWLSANPDVKLESSAP